MMASTIYNTDNKVVDLCDRGLQQNTFQHGPISDCKYHGLDPHFRYLSQYLPIFSAAHTMHEISMGND